MLAFPTEVERWVALRTAARSEKRLAQLLSERGTRVFLPLMSRVSVYHEKTRTVQIPVFSGYVFCDESDYLQESKRCPAIAAKVAQMLRPPDPARLRAELKDIADLMTDRTLLQEHVAGGVGDRVRIIGGSLAGYGGKIVRTSPNRWVVVLEMSFLGARQEVEIDSRMVEKCLEDAE